MRWIGIDWSGPLSGEANHIWTAVADTDGVNDLRAGRTRNQLTAWLAEEAERDPEFVVGFDFAFGLPAWFATGTDCPRRRSPASSPGAPQHWYLP